MQKIFRKNAVAKAHVQRRKAAEKLQELKTNRVLFRDQAKLRQQDIRKSVLAERTGRREDWILGPLAPQRDVGDMKDTYGTVSRRELRGVEKLEGTWKDWCIKEGDRVVIVGAKQRDRGKIGTVAEVNEKSEDCVVDGLNMVDVAAPAFLRDMDQDQSHIRSIEAAIPLSDVRLVHPLPHPETGILRDVIINSLKRMHKNGPRHIDGLKPRTVIPFPSVPKPEEEDHDIDTLRIEVEQITWTPTLLRPPMPSSVIDELRNKYSAFRDRHDDEYVASIERRAAKREEKERERFAKMRTPLQDLQKVQRKERRKKGRKPLDEETLSGIGELIARHRGLTVGGEENKVA